MTDVFAWIAQLAVLFVSPSFPPPPTGVHYETCTQTEFSRCSNLISAAVSSGSASAMNQAADYCRASGCLAN